MHIKTKDPTEYTGVESYVFQKFTEDDISWLPMHTALALDAQKDQSAGDDNNLSKVLEMLTEQLKMLKKRAEDQKKKAEWPFNMINCIS